MVSNRTFYSTSCIIVVAIVSSTFYLQYEIVKSQYFIEDVYHKMENIKVENHSPAIVSENNKFATEENRSYQQEIFYELLRDSEFEKYIVRETFIDPEVPQLKRVLVSVQGTENVLRYLDYLADKSKSLYLKDNM